MNWGFLGRIRHPLYPDLAAISASRARRVAPALAGTMDELRSAASDGVSVRRAVYVLLGEARPFLTEEERDFLWNAFQVPVYGLLRGDSRKILGYECEVQDGFHMRAPGITARAAKVVESPCECGRPGARMIFVEPTLKTEDQLKPQSQAGLGPQLRISPA